MSRPLRIALLTSEQGPAGIWSPSARACADLATAELNASGGILRRPVKLVVADTGRTADSAAQAAAAAIDIAGADAIVGMFPSFARRAVARAIGGTVPFLYTPQFEGFERDATILTTGETSTELLATALRRLIEAQGRRRFYLCGNDYLWPRGSFAAARRLIAAYGGEVVGERYLPLETEDFEALTDAIEASGADVVLPHFLGLDAIGFHRAFGRSGLARRILRFASAVDETVIYGLGEDATENLFVASAYFACLRSRNNGDFLERYHTRFGDTPPPVNAYGQSCYEGLYCLASLAEAAGSLDPIRLRGAMGRSQQRRSARGQEADPVTGSRHQIHVGRVDGYEISILPNF